MNQRSSVISGGRLYPTHLGGPMSVSLIEEEGQSTERALSSHKWETTRLRRWSAIKRGLSLDVFRASSLNTSRALDSKQSCAWITLGIYLESSDVSYRLYGLHNRVRLPRWSSEYPAPAPEPDKPTRGPRSTPRDPTNRTAAID